MRKGITIEQGFFDKFKKPGGRLVYNRTGVTLELLVFEPTRMKKKGVSHPGYDGYALCGEVSFRKFYIKEEQKGLVTNADIDAITNWLGICWQYRTYGKAEYDRIIESHARELRLRDKPIRIKMNNTTKEHFAKLIETDIAQLLLFIKPVRQGAELSMITKMNGKIYIRKEEYDHIKQAEMTVSLMNSSRAVGIIKEMAENG